MFVSYTLDIIYRVRSRAVVIPFNGPSVGPEDAIEDELFDFLERVLESNRLSQCIGWVISLGHALKETGKSFVTELREKLRDRLSSRHCTNWGILLFFLNKVSLPFAQTYMYLSCVICI